MEAQDLDDGGFSSEYQARLTEDYEGEKERTNHEENINKRHDYLKIRLDKANAVRKNYFISIINKLFLGIGKTPTVGKRSRIIT